MRTLLLCVCALAAAGCTSSKSQAATPDEGAQQSAKGTGPTAGDAQDNDATRPYQHAPVAKAGDAQGRARALWQPVVDAADRTEDDRKLDEGRHPAETLELVNPKPGMKVAELGAGGGYTTELLARAVGPSGVVYAQNPAKFVKGFLKDIWPARLARPAMKNVVRVDREFDDPLPPEAKNLDAVLINVIYHDTVYMGVDRARMNRAVFSALQPGGAYVVIDSSAKPGAGDKDAKTLHRIDEELVKKEVLAAGFRLDRESDFLRNPQDARDWNSSPGASPQKRGSNDRFALRFVKPENARAEIEPPKLRLPTTATPLSYEAQLTVVPTAETFEGSLTMRLSVKEPLALLWLNADQLDVRETDPKSRVVDGGQDFVGLEFEKPLPAGEQTLRIKWQGKLSRTDSDGAFKQQENGEWYVLTHLESLGARRIFPSFDEPGFKTPWQLTLRVRKSDEAFSNTMPEVEKADGDFKIVKFARTKPLPTYLLAFGVGPFEVLPGGKSKGGVPVRVIVTKGKRDWATYSAESSPKLLDLLQDYFQVPYNYGKLDLIEIPINSGAMENAGLVTFVQRINLVKPSEETPQFRRSCASVETHEFAHQWFGDLVTTAWWDDIWLNEAFATWMTPKILDRYEPKWGAAAGRVESKNGAMNLDRLLSARRIRQPIESDGDIKGAFDGITYQKGAAVIGMFEAYVGEDKFQQGVNAYLLAHKDGNATAREFLASISEAAGKDVAPAFSTFLDQAGVPLVSAKLSCEGGKGKLALAQARYFSAGTENAAQDQTWQIPVCAKWGRGPKTGRACTLLAGRTGELTLPACPDWVLPNDGSTGYYRMVLDEKGVKALASHAAQLSVPERLGFVFDVLAMARAGKARFAQLLAIVPAFATDKDRHVVQATLQIVDLIDDQRMVPDGLRQRYAKLVRDLYGKRAQALGFAPKKGEDEETRLLRPSIVSIVGDKGEDPKLLAEAKKLANAWLSDRSAVSAEMIGTVLSLAAKKGDRAFFDRLRTSAMATPERNDRMRMISALGQFRDPALAQEADALTLSPDFDPRETLFNLYEQGGHPSTRTVAWDFMKKNYDALVKRMPRDSAAGFPGLPSTFCDEEHQADVKEFFKDRAPKVANGERRLANALESMKVCTAQRKLGAAGVASFLQKR